MADRTTALIEWANRCLREDVPLDVLAEALPYSGAGDDEAMTVIDRLADAGWLIVPTPEVDRITSEHSGSTARPGGES